MANTKELLGAMMRRGMTESSVQRIEHSLSEQGGLSGILEQVLGLSPAKEKVAAQGREQAEPGGPMDAFGEIGAIAKSILGGNPQTKSLAAGGLGALVGALFGGGSASAKGALGGGALALLGSIALQALQTVGKQKSKLQIDPATKLMAGLREPEGAQEESEVQSIVDLTIKAMINAAKADGAVDVDEMQNIVGEMQEDGISQAEREYLLAEVRKPMNTDEIVRAVTNPQVAAQVYAASLLAIEVDSPEEKRYLVELARKLNLDDRVVNNIHNTLGVA